MSDKCYSCKGKAINQKVNVDSPVGENLVVIEGVPAEVCQQCGEKYFQADVYKEMEKLARGKATPSRHLTVDVIKFDHPVLV